MKREMRSRSFKSFLNPTHTVTASLFHSLCAVVVKEITEKPPQVFTAYVSVFLLESHANVLVTFVQYSFSSWRLLISVRVSYSPIVICR